MSPHQVLEVSRASKPDSNAFQHDVTVARNGLAGLIVHVVHGATIALRIVDLELAELLLQGVQAATEATANVDKTEETWQEACRYRQSHDRTEQDQIATPERLH